VGLLDAFKKQAEDVVRGHGSQIKAGIGKAADFADKKTSGKYRDKIELGKRKAHEVVDRIDDTRP
jgi:hypothetical protein